MFTKREGWCDGADQSLLRPAFGKGRDERSPLGESSERAGERDIEGRSLQGNRSRKEWTSGPSITPLKPNTE